MSFIPFLLFTLAVELLMQGSLLVSQHSTVTKWKYTHIIKSVKFRSKEIFLFSNLKQITYSLNWIPDHSSFFLFFNVPTMSLQRPFLLISNSWNCYVSITIIWLSRNTLNKPKINWSRRKPKDRRWTVNVLQSWIELNTMRVERVETLSACELGAQTSGLRLIS